MAFFTRFKNLRFHSNSSFAQVIWAPTQIEKNALEKHSFVKEIERVDQIWPWLKDNHGQILAVDAPHCIPPEKFNYHQLAERISIAAAAFHKLGILRICSKLFDFYLRLIFLHLNF